MTAFRSRHGLLRHRLIAFTRMLQGVEAGRARSIHRIRVATRRLRELLPVLQLEHGVAHKLGHRLRRVTRRLGVLREVDALIALLDDLRESKRDDDRALSCVRDALQRQRAERRARASTKTLSAELRRIAAKLDKVAEAVAAADRTRTPERGWHWAIDARLRHRAEKTRQAVAAAGNLYLADRLHAVRIAVKKLRYALELKSEASPERGWAPRLAALKRRQVLLGALHDRQVLMDRVRQVQASLPQPELGVWRALDAMNRSLENECRRLHARYVRDVPALVAACDQAAGAGEEPRVRRRAG